MKTSTVTFPSVFEETFGNTDNSSQNLLNGLKIRKDLKWYMVGNLAKRGGISATRITNASPVEDFYDILFKSAMINVLPDMDGPISLTVGFPLSTYNLYKGVAEDIFKKRYFLAEYDTNTYNAQGGIKKVSFEVERYEIVPEITGCINGLKKVLSFPEPSNFLAISLGFGTMEGGLVTEDGLVSRTCFSTHGLQYAIDNLNKELNKKYYLELKNVHQMDDAFMRGRIFINRKPIDILDIRKDLLQQYYRQIILPVLRKYLSDSDFENCQTAYLFGGGAYYKELVDLIEEEFYGAISVEVAPEPDKIASIGYLYNSYRISGKYQNRCVGIDIGNATTAVSIFQNEKNFRG